MKTPRFFIDADDERGNRLVGEAANMELAKNNAYVELQAALDYLAKGRDGSKVVLVLSRKDMTDKEARALD